MLDLWHGLLEKAGAHPLPAGLQRFSQALEHFDVVAAQAELEYYLGALPQTAGEPMENP